MKFKKFLDVARTPVQAYFKEGVELIYPDQKRTLQLAILPAYNPKDPSPTGFLPAVVDGEESDFYTVIRAAKFVGSTSARMPRIGQTAGKASPLPPSARCSA